MRLRNQGTCTFGGLRLDMAAAILWHGDHLVTLPPTPAKILVALVGLAGQVVDKAELRSAVWGETTVSDSVVARTVSRLREELESLGLPDCIQTVSRRGYRFTLPVEHLTASNPSREEPLEPTIPAIPSPQSLVSFFIEQSDVSQQIGVPTFPSPVATATLPFSATSAAETLPKSTKVQKWMPLMAAVVPALVATVSIVTWLRGQPADFRVDGNDLVVTNERGWRLWHRRFPSNLFQERYGPNEIHRRSWMGDLSGDGERRLIFTENSENMGSVGTPVFCFRTNGDIAWQFLPGRPVSDRGGVMVPPYWTNRVRVMIGKSAKDTRIVISSNHYADQPNQVAFLDVNGRVVAEYWHPGHLYYLEPKDLDGDGREELLLGGVNNGNHQATMVVLDPLKMSGVVTPKEMRDRQFELLNMETAKEKAVVFFPRSCISVGQPYTRVTDIHITKQRIIVFVAEGTDEREPGFTYEFDYGLHVLNVAPTGVAVQQRHEELEAKGKLDHAYDLENECALLKSEVVVRRGE